jgi:hypothetical protein
LTALVVVIISFTALQFWRASIESRSRAVLAREVRLLRECMLELTGETPKPAKTLREILADMHADEVVPSDSSATDLAFTVPAKGRPE